MTDNPFDPNGPSDGEPNAATIPRYCRKCEAEVVPEGKGKCPRCGSFLRLNFVARKHAVNVLRRETLYAELVAEYQPADILERSNCEHLAATLEQLETMRPGTTEWQRLVTIAQTLGSALRDARSNTGSASPSGLEQVPTSALNAAADLLTRQLNGETLSERELGRLDVLQDAMASRVSLAPDRPPAGDFYEVPEPGDPDYREVIDAPTRSAATPATPQPPVCAYCHQPCCGPEHPAFQTLHWSDPAEIARRDREHRDDEADARQFVATGMISSRMRAKAEARQPTMSDEEKRQAEKRRQLGWDEGVLNETTGVYRRHE